MIGIPLTVLGAGLLVGAAMAPTASWVSSVVTTVDDTMLDYPPLPDDLGTLEERSVILDADGNTLSIVRDTNRKVVTLDEIPQHVRDAVVATEDAQFYTHEGVNWNAIARAALGNVQAGGITSGGSTITQQLVKNAFLLGEDGGRAEQSLDRKLQEAVYAVQLEHKFSKDEILERYMNTAYLGNGVYGFGTAAESYFSKPVGELTVAEGALLAGMLRAPEVNDPIDRPDQALGRRSIVLRQMAQSGFLTSEEAARADTEPLDLSVQRFSRPSESAIVTYVIEQLKQDPALGPDEATRFGTLATAGLTIRTTINPRVQREVNAAIREVLDGSDGISAASATVDPRTGAIHGIGFGPQEFGTGPGQIDVNPAVPGLGSPVGRQPGSAFKAIQVVAALEAGVSPAYTTDTPSPYQPTGECPTSYNPSNFAESGGGVMDMAQATARSSNVYFVHLVDELTGPAALAETARRMGIVNSPLGDFCSNVLGGGEVFPLDMAVAFGTLANNGVRCDPFVIAEVLDRTGRVISRGGDQCERAVDADIAATATGLLRGPIEAGTASRHGQIGRPAAGKTGTAQEFADATFAGYIPQLSSAVWVGDPYERRTLTHELCGGNVTGGCLPTMIWQRTMTSVIAALDLPVEDFPAPPPIPTATVPSVVGQPQETASEVITEAGFYPRIEIVDDYRPPGEVVEQEPAGGGRAPVGSAVLLSVSSGEGEPPTLPNLVGLELAEALEILQGLEIEVFARVVETPVDAEQVGRVLATSPPAGTPLAEGLEVVLEVGRARTPEEEAPDDDGDDPGDDADSGDDGDGDDSGDDGDGDDSGEDGDGEVVRPEPPNRPPRPPDPDPDDDGDPDPPEDDDGDDGDDGSEDP